MAKYRPGPTRTSGMATIESPSRKRWKRRKRSGRDYYFEPGSGVQLNSLVLSIGIDLSKVSRHEVLSQRPLCIGLLGADS